MCSKVGCIIMHRCMHGVATGWFTRQLRCLVPSWQGKVFSFNLSTCWWLIKVSGTGNRTCQSLCVGGACSGRTYVVELCARDQCTLVIKMQLYIVYALALFCVSLSSGRGETYNHWLYPKKCETPFLLLDGNPADDCTADFMSLDRMDAVLSLVGPIAHANGNYQTIYPETYFTCNGSILSWTIGAGWCGSSSLLELQIWRRSDVRAYTKVGSTTITVANESPTRLYKFPVSPPLPFEAGDILGYYQPDIRQSQLQMYYEENGRSQSGYAYSGASSVLNLDLSILDTSYQALIDVTTGELLMHSILQFNNYLVTVLY